MSRDIKRWTSACLICKRRKTPRPMNAGTPSIVCKYRAPRDTAAIDLQGPLTATAKGHRYILTMLDLCTRWATAVPIKSKEAGEVAHAIYIHLITKRGIFRRIFSDRGSEFINKGLRAMCRKWGMKTITTTGWQPQANPVERIHRWLNSGMTTMHAAFGTEWDQYVDAMVFAHNISKSESTGFSPYQLEHGHEPILPEDVMYNLNRTEDEFKTEEAYAINCGKWMEKAFQHVQKQQLRMAKKNQDRRADHMKEVNFQTGDHVLYWQPANPYVSNDKAQGVDTQEAEAITPAEAIYVPPKWRPKWSGPHIIQAKTADNLYTFEHCKTGKDTTAHVNRLVHFSPWTVDLLSTSRQLDEERPWRTGGDIQQGTLIIMGLHDDECPFGMGKVLRIEKDNTIHFQWMCNRANNVRAKQENGWLDTNGAAYYQNTKRHRQDRPYTGADSNTTITADNVILHSFQLTRQGQRIPTPVLRAIMNSGQIDYDTQTT